MKTKLKTRIFAFALILAMLLPVLPITAFAQEASSPVYSQAGNDSYIDPSPVIKDDEGLIDFPLTFRDVSTSSELEAALADGIDAICITADFEIDRTFYVASNTIVYSEKQITLTRSPEFAGDIFVVGQDKDDNLCSETVVFSLGGYSTDSSGSLIINGNSENMTVDVCGTVVFVCPNAQADLYNNLTITNCKKVGNERALNSIYELSNTSYIGGAVAILSKSSFMNIYGGVYSHNSVNTSGSSIYGGAFYNFATMNVYGGIFEGNSAVRAGAFYNYRTLCIYNATIKDNTASTSGGAIYLPASTGAKLYLGGISEYCDSSVTFSSNTASSYGGAIYSTGRITAQDTVFSNNSATNGGAIYSGGSYCVINITNSSFNENTAEENGGAICVSGHNTLEVDTDLTILNTTFASNSSAENGGAIAILKGAYLYGRDLSFEQNTATGTGGAIDVTASTAELDNVKLLKNEATSGAGICLRDESSVVLNKIDAQSNSASNNGGVIYSTASTLSMYNSSIKANTAKAGSALYLYTSAVSGIYGSHFTANTCLESNTSNAGAVFVYTGAVETIIHSCTFTQNSSSGLGGGIFVSGKSNLKLYNTTAIENNASKGGFMYETTAGTIVTISGLTVSGNTAAVGGPIIWGNTANAKLFINKLNHVDLDITGSLPSTYWSDAIANKLTVTETDDTIPSYTDYSGEVVSDFWDATVVKTFEELEAAISNKAPMIKIVSDIEFNKTLYITSNTVIFTTTYCKLTRSSSFTDELFVIGKDKEGVATESGVSLTLGLTSSATSDLLVIDGANVASNSLIRVCGGSEVCVYDNVTITNCLGQGGAVISVEENATASLFGGKIVSNESTEKGVILNSGALNIENGIIEENKAVLGGAIYNLGTLTVNGGTIRANSAENGGAVFNEGIITLNGGSIEENTATENGGAVYMLSGSIDICTTISANNAANGGALYIENGSASITDATIESNSATNGGAIYLNNSDAIVLLAQASFISNSAENGGALYLANCDIDINDSSFNKNNATNGGAIYVENSDVSFSKNNFNSNTATNGGAIYLTNSQMIASELNSNGDKANENGGFIYGVDSAITLSGNTIKNADAYMGGAVYAENSKLSSSNDTFEGCLASLGGAIYGTYADITVKASTFLANSADYNGGAIAADNSNVYVTNADVRNNSADNDGGAIYSDKSVLTVYSTTFNANTANANGGALSVDEGSNAEVYSSIFVANKAKRNGGVAYASYVDTSLTVQLCQFTENEANNYGGVLYACNQATVNVYNTTANTNKATRGGFVYLTDNDTNVTVIDITVSANKATYGQIAYGNSGAILYINKNEYKDTETENLNTTYFSKALYGVMTVKAITDSAPEYIEEGNEPAGSLENATEVSNAGELESALLAGKKVIKVVSDFEIDRTFFITYNVTIFSTAYHTLTRAADFGGDLFVIGEASDGTNSMLESADDMLTIGNPESNTPGLLTIDGNKDNMTVDVYGTVFFVCNGAVANFYENLSVVNCHKVDNERTYSEQHKLSRPNRVGGSVAIIPFGAVNVYGGAYKNNSIKLEDASTEEGRNSTNGGVFYNESNIKIYAGLFENNEGARGGIIYNYGTMKIYGGSFIANHATISGGVYYSSSSSVSQLNIGYKSDSTVIFKDNVAEVSGGTIYTTTLNGVVLYGNVIFENNQALTGNGGAINTSSTFTIRNVTFKDNKAKSRGGAIFATKATESYVTRFVHLENCLFIGNDAATGGAVALYSGSSEYAEGSIVTIVNSEFTSNTATTAGAISAERKSKLTIKGSTFNENVSENEAGALYIIGEANVTISDSKITNNKAGSHGGAISVRSSDLTIKTSIIENNETSKNGGAIYVAYSSNIDRNAKVTISDSAFKGNTSPSSGGAIYATRREIENDTKVLTVKSTDFAQNVADNNGGAVLLTGGVDVYMKDVSFVSNSVKDKSDGVGGAIGIFSSTLEIDGGVFTKNSSNQTGGAINVGAGSTATLNNIVASRNSARTNGGFAYSIGTLTIYNSSIKNNSSNMGAGMYLYENATSSIYGTEFTNNRTTENGAALFVYTFGAPTVINSCSFDSNKSDNFGGGLYISGKSLASLYNITATDNSAVRGGFMYETTAGTIVTLADLTVSGNTADNGGNIIWGNTANATLDIDKSKYTDLDAEGTLDDNYWDSAIDGSLTVNSVTVSVPSAPKYNSAVESVKTTPVKAPVSVNDIFNLAVNSSDGFINSTYDKFPVLDNSSNFMSREETFFENINGETVKVDTYVYPKYSTAHNMTVGEALMIYQAMLYKKANPDENVEIDIASYRFSVQTAVNINRDSRYFGYTRALVNENYDKFGFVRVSYLLISAAKMGIKVNVLAHRDAYPVTYSSVIPSTVIEYFESQLNDPCDPDYTTDKVIGDYLSFHYFDWTLSEGGKGGTDMMHTKLCAVSHYLDMNGEVHRNAVWTSSSNLDGIYAAGYNANWKLQTATIISDHEYIYRVSVNYLRLMTTLDGQEEIIEFQNIMNEETTKQIDLILAGRGNEIPLDEQLVYIGTENDDVFELYFTPFGGDILSWSEVYNPYSKYMRELYESEDYIVFTWNAAEYSGSFPLAQQLEKMLIDAFHNNKNPNNKIYVNMESFDATTFDDLVVGVDIGYKSINKWELGSIHNKDLQFSYVKNGQRYYVSLLNSCNLHSGSMYFQSNFALVIKETTCAMDSVFSTVAKYSTTGDLVTHSFGEELRKEPTPTEHGEIYRECLSCGDKEVISTLHYDSEWIVEKVATPSENGIRYKKCTVCNKLLESEETKFVGTMVNPENNTGTGFTDNTTIPVSIQKTPLTFEATIQLNKNHYGRGGVIFGNYSSMNDENAISLEIFTEGKVRLFSINNGIRTDILFKTDIRSSEPVHIAVTVDGTTASLYINGVLTESLTASNSLPIVDKDFVIGGDNRQVDIQTFKGKIYSFVAFDEVRSADEIKADMEYVGEKAENVLVSKYFTSNNAPSYVAGSSISGTKFNSSVINGIDKLENPFATIEAVIKLPATHSDRAGVIIGNYNGSNNDTINIEVLAGGKLRLFYIANGIRYDYSFATDIRSDEPTHIAITAEGTTVSLYVNGVFAESISVTASLPSVTEGFAIGGDYRLNNEQYFKGTIYSVHLFDNVRTAEEIVSDMIFVDKSDSTLLHSTYFTSNGIANSFDGQTFNDKLYGGLPCDINGTPLTFEAVIQLSPDYSNRGGIIVSNNGKNKQIVSFEIFKDGKFRLYFVNGAQTIDCKFDTDVRSDKPVHVALTVDSTTASLYINGELTEVKELSLPLPESTSGYHIGGDFRKGNTQYFKGTIYSVNLFDQVRSAEEIKQDMRYFASAGNLVSTTYMNSTVVDEVKFHNDAKFEIITEATPSANGTGRYICNDCGKILGYYDIPYMSNGIINNNYENTDSALTGNGYYKIEEIFGQSPATFEILLKLSPNFTDRAGVILGNYDGTASGRMNLEIYTNGNPRLWYKVDGVSYSYIFSADIRSDEAVHLAFTIDGLSASLYINGVLSETVSLSCEVPFDGSTFYVGTDARIYAQSFKGEIYSASIFADIRTPEEIKRDMIMITSDTDNLLFSKYFVASEIIEVKGPWAGKNAIFVGDSITYGANCEGSKYWELLKDSLELNSAEGMGVSGSCISSTSDYGTDYEPLTDRYDTIPQADLITIFMGTNDYGHDTPLGTIEDTTDVSFYGALNVIIPALLTNHPDATIVFITPIHRYGYGTNSSTGEAHTFDHIPNGAGHTLGDYVNAILEVCEKYSVPVIDLYSNLDLDPSAEEVREYYMEDGLHPNSAGHRLIADYLNHALTDLGYTSSSESTN